VTAEVSGQWNEAVLEAGEIPISASALRMRRSRELRRKGLTCYCVQLREIEIDKLVKYGLLATEDRGNKVAVVNALHAFFDKSFV